MRHPNRARFISILQIEVQVVDQGALPLQPHPRATISTISSMNARAQNQNVPRMPGRSVGTTLVFGWMVRHQLTE